MALGISEKVIFQFLKSALDIHRILVLSSAAKTLVTTSDDIHVNKYIIFFIFGIINMTLLYYFLRNSK